MTSVGFLVGKNNIGSVERLPAESRKARAGAKGDSSAAHTQVSETARTADTIADVSACLRMFKDTRNGAFLSPSRSRESLMAHGVAQPTLVFRYLNDSSSMESWSVESPEVQHDSSVVSLTAFARLVRTNVNFRRLWLAQMVSEIGDWFYTLAIYTLLLQLTGRASSVGLALILQVLPLTFMGPTAGVVNDRVSRKRVMIVSDVVRMVSYWRCCWCARVQLCG